MLAYTVIGEGGGIAKTTTAANLAVAHHRRGRNVLAVDLSPQGGGLSYLLDVSGDRDNPDADSITGHLIDRPQGDFENLVVTSLEGPDIIPSHQSLERLPELLKQAGDLAENVGGDWDPHARLYEVLQEAGVYDDYDVLIVDVPGNGEKFHTNALYATRNVVVPVELSAKGDTAIADLEETAEAMDDILGIELGVLAMVPVMFKGTKAQQERLDDLEASPYAVPVRFRDRTSLCDRFWSEQMSVFTYREAEELRDYEADYPLKMDALAEHLENEAGLESAPHSAASERRGAS